MNASDPIKLSKNSCKEGAVHIWHLDEAVISIRGKKHWLWRAVDQDGFVLEVLVQSRRNTKAAKRLMRKLMKGQGHSPRVMITGKFLWRGKARHHARRRTSITQRPEQPGGEFPSTDSATRTDHEGLQVSPTSPAFRFHS
jgi:transposase-like protein